MTTANYSTAKQRQILWASCRQSGMTDDDIRELIYNATNGRTESSKKMTYSEISNLIDKLNQEYRSSLDKMRKKIISYAHKLDWQASINGRQVADLERVNNFCIKSTPSHKELNKQSRSELVQTVTVFEAMYRKYIEN